MLIDGKNIPLTLQNNGPWYIGKVIKLQDSYKKKSADIVIVYTNEYRRKAGKPHT